MFNSHILTLLNLLSELYKYIMMIRNYKYKRSERERHICVKYLKAIGFSDLNSRKKTDELINEIKKNPSRKNWFQIDEEEAIFIYEKDFAEAAGIAVIEVMDRDGYRVTDHFYPYVRGANYLYHEDLEFEHYTDKEGYAGICDENNIGIPTNISCK